MGQPSNFREVAAIPATTYATTVDSIRTQGVGEECPTPSSATLIGRAHSFYKAHDILCNDAFLTVHVVCVHPFTARCLGVRMLLCGRAYVEKPRACIGRVPVLGIFPGPHQTQIGHSLLGYAHCAFMRPRLYRPGCAPFWVFSRSLS